MTIQEETDEYRFVQHVVGILDVPNSRPDLEPGGLWTRGKLQLSWGLSHMTQPPTLVVARIGGALNGQATFLPFDMEGRLLVWRTAWANRDTSIHRGLTELDFRDVVAITAILAWNKPAANDD